LHRSIEYARANPAVSAGFVRQYAQELSEEVTRSHIELFVNDYSVDLGAEGRKAVTGLLSTETFGIKEEEVFV
jgi:1,4-dihydroxy-6-naphthoate synthase